MIPMNWETARELLSDVNKELCDSICALYSATTNEYKEKLKISIVKYPFSSTIIRNGIPLLPGSMPFDSDYLFSSGLPLGIIINNYSEVIEYKPVQKDKDRRLSYQSKAILSKSDFLGVFELMDCLNSVNVMSIPDWTILSGCNNFFLSGKILETKFNIIRDSNDISMSYNEFCSATFLGEILFKIINDKEECNLATDILYFGKYWESLLYADEAACNNIFKKYTVEVKLNRERAKNVLLSKAWSAASVGRDIHSTLLKYFSDNDGQYSWNGYVFMTSILDIIYKRRAVYRAARKNTCMIPYNEIVEKILRPSDLGELVLIPKYFRSDRDNYIPLQMIIPDIGSGKKAMFDVLSGALHDIATARDRVKEDGNIEKLFDLFFSTTLRAEFMLPRNQKGRNSSVFSFVQKTGSKSYQQKYIEKGSFITGGHAYENSYFFKACMKFPADSGGT